MNALNLDLWQRTENAAKPPAQRTAGWCTISPEIEEREAPGADVHDTAGACRIAVARGTVGPCGSLTASLWCPRCRTGEIMSRLGPSARKPVKLGARPSVARQSG